MESDSAAETAGPERPRLSREEASRALVDAAATLFAERPSGRVTVREIAARAGVNPTYVHRYFGGKQALMRAAMEKSQRAIAANITGMADLRQDLGILFDAIVGEKEFVAVLARASLDGVLPDFPAGYPTMSGLLQRIEAELAAGASSGRYDPRVVVACLGSLTLGYALFGQFIRRGARLEGQSEEELRAAIVAVLREIIGLALDDPVTARNAESTEAG